VVLPTTCDWSVKLEAAAERCGFEFQVPVRRLELPRQKERVQSQERWREEVHGLRLFLAEVAKRKLKPRALAKDLSHSMALYRRAGAAFIELGEARRRGQVAAIWAQVIANAFFFDRVETWTERLGELLSVLTAKASEVKTQSGARPGDCLGEQGQPVFLAGSPIFFPNLKVFHLLEEAGLDAVYDDLCSSSRLLPGPIPYDDPSWAGLLKALAQRYQQACLCPTFIDNDRRINNILAPEVKKEVKGVVYHVLKGCHPFDLESLSLEGAIREAGLRYLKIETDYAAEDAPALLTRLEALEPPWLESR
jgi:benzoyl-CoA reductase/2-hydroxyglutaryl-CoA dehydratase subunit BcrC/BadD/HgdB